MTRTEYTDRVLAALRRLTPEEKNSVRTEIDAHIEDHICTLLDLGYDEALAEERTMARMGDPEEVGRELDKQYPMGWLVLKWAAMALAAVLAVMLLTQVSWKTVWLNLQYRLAPDPVNYEKLAFLEKHPVDIRMELDGVVVRVCSVGIMKATDYPDWEFWESDAKYLAAVTLCAYSAKWSDLEIQQSIPGMFCVEGAVFGWGGSGSQMAYFVSVEPGEESITASYQQYGYDECIQIPLDWEGVI